MAQTTGETPALRIRSSRRSIAIFLSVVVSLTAFGLSAPCRAAGESSSNAPMQSGIDKAARDLFPNPTLTSPAKNNYRQDPLTPPLSVGWPFQAVGRLESLPHRGEGHALWSAKGLEWPAFPKAPAMNYRRDTGATNDALSPRPSPMGRGGQEDDEEATGPDNDDNYPSVLLTPVEYEQLEQILRIGGATPLVVAAVKGAGVGVTVLIAMCAFILGLVIMRRIFNFWWDKDLYDNTWASTCIVCMKLLVLGWIITAAVRG